MPKKEQSKPNILVIFGDDIGITNLSVYSDGLKRSTTITNWDWNLNHVGSAYGIRALHELKEEKVLAAAATATGARK